MQRAYYARWHLPACNHTARHPFTHSFILGSLNLCTFPETWTSAADTERREKFKGLSHFDSISKAFIPFCPQCGGCGI